MDKYREHKKFLEYVGVGLTVSALVAIGSYVSVLAYPSPIVLAFVELSPSGMIVDVENLGGEEETVAINALVVDDSTGAVVTEVSGSFCLPSGSSSTRTSDRAVFDMVGDIGIGDLRYRLDPGECGGVGARTDGDSDSDLLIGVRFSEVDESHPPNLRSCASMGSARARHR